MAVVVQATVSALRWAPPARWCWAIELALGSFEGGQFSSARMSLGDSTPTCRAPCQLAQRASGSARRRSPMSMTSWYCGASTDRAAGRRAGPLDSALLLRAHQVRPACCRPHYRAYLCAETIFCYRRLPLPSDFGTTTTPSCAVGHAAVQPQHHWSPGGNHCCMLAAASETSTPRA
jgi:hypothetical protein